MSKTKFRVPHFDNLDASENAFFARELEHVAARTYDKKYAELKARMFIPVNNQVHTGAETYTYYQFDQVGAAALLKSYAQDLPRADVLGKMFTSVIRGMGVSYGYSVQELRAAQLAGRPLDQKKANAARRAFEELVDKIARTGDAAANLGGFINAANMISYTPANGLSGSATWASKTPDEIVADVVGMTNAMIDATFDREHPDTLLLPLVQYGLTSKRMGDGSNQTIRAHILETSPYIKAIEPWWPLKGAGAGPSDRAILYRRDPEALELIIPQEFEQFSPQQDGLEFTVPCHGRIGGVVFYYPMSALKADGI